MLTRRLAFATAVLLVALHTLAESTLAQSPEPATPDTVALDSAAVARFADAFFATHMDSLRAPGAVFTVVRDRQVVFSNGYGLAHVGRGIPVDPKTTRFRLAAVALPFTATAKIQLVETGRLCMLQGHT
jgi:CubicO group peptidase (beta-lactamase class C family)